jgi:hypothetical protein
MIGKKLVIGKIIMITYNLRVEKPQAPIQRRGPGVTVSKLECA